MNEKGKKPRLTRQELDEQRANSETLQALVKVILADKRLSWMIVDAYMRENGYLMLPQDWIESKMIVG